MKIRPLNKALGAEVSGIDLSKPLSTGQVQNVINTFLKYHLICLKSKPLSPKQFYKVACYFGTPFSETSRFQWDKDFPQISRLDSTYKSKSSKPQNAKESRLSGWHTDHSFKEFPPKATLLHSLQIPSKAGQTRFCNTEKSYQDLPEKTKSQLDTFQAIHSYDTVRAPARPPQRTPEEIAETPDVKHPLIREHDETGKKAIYFNAGRLDRIVGLTREKSNQILDQMHDHITQDKYRYDHNWCVGDIVIWDNRCLVHSVNVDYPVGEPRIHLRTLLKGKRPSSKSV